MSDHVKGLLLTTLGVLFVSPDTLLIRLADLDVWNLAVWRGLLSGIGLVLVLALYYGRRTPAVFMAIGTTGLLLAVVFTGNAFAFIGAILYTKVANALIILATAPFFAAVLSYLFLKEHVALRTWLAILVALTGIGLIVAEGLGGGTLLGDGLAVLAALLLGLKLVIVRHRRDVNMIPAIALSAFMFAAIALPFSQPAEVSQMQMLWLLLMGFAVLTPATVLITLGPRYIAAPEVALVVLLETVLGPLWVWIAIGEAPSNLGLIGGAIVLAALAVHALLSLRAQRRLAPA